MEWIRDFFIHLTVFDVIDVAIVALLLVKLFGLIRETRAEQLIKGIIALLVATKLSDIFQLYTIQWVLKNIMSYGILLIIIMFQPELRRALEYIGRSRVFSKPIIEVRGEEAQKTVDEIVKAATSLSRQQIGALMVIERKTGLNDYVETGTALNATVSADLLINIFIPNTPLHDGAVIIKDDRIKGASCFLPLTENQNLSKELGTRHRAALGITERSDALSIIVSEETGAVSVAENGKIARHIDEQTLTKILLDIYNPQDEGQSLLSGWRSRNDEEQEEE